MTRGYWIGAIVLGVAVIIAPVFAQSSAQPQRDHEHASPAQKEQVAPAPRIGMMGQDHQRMMAEMKTAHDRLQDLVSKMNTATGDQKVNAIADLLKQLVMDQANMHQHMMEMHDQMMAHK
jgi:ABC-type dipeptide/oligopeptide/nickel transport system ATPase subunit